MEELGITSGTNLNSPYINQVNTVDDLIQTHATTLADVFNIKLQQKDKNLPQIYWIPKLHKIPYKARLIAGVTADLDPPRIWTPLRGFGPPTKHSFFPIYSNCKLLGDVL